MKRSIVPFVIHSLTGCAGGDADDRADRFVPLEVGGDYVLGRWSDELDVQHVRLYDLTVR